MNMYSGPQLFVPSIYTDGFKIGMVVAAAAVLDKHISKSRLPDGASILSAELRGGNDKFVILSDSLSSLQALGNLRLDNPIVQNTVLCTSPNIVVFCWLPIHVGIRGNDLADSTAKAALYLNISPFK